MFHPNSSELLTVLLIKICLLQTACENGFSIQKRRFTAHTHVLIAFISAKCIYNSQMTHGKGKRADLEIIKFS